MTNQTARVLELLKRFNNNQKVCIESLQNEYLWDGMSEKTIRRDLNVLKSIFPESFELIRGEKGCYKAMTKEVFENFLNADAFALLVQTFNLTQNHDLFDNFDIEDSDKSIIKTKLNESKKVYEFKNKPFENKSDSFNLLKKLESCIHHNKYIYINYQLKDKVEQYEVKPYKIVFMNENFYLACEIEDNPNFEFTMYRINKIVDIIDTSKTFRKNPDIEDFIKNGIQTPFSRYKQDYRKHLVEIVVEVSAFKAQYFQMKKHLNSQEIIEEKEDGSLIIKYIVTQEFEVDELIKKWIPHMKVISPVSLKKKINSELTNYLNT